jgi:hypothetical protein
VTCDAIEAFMVEVKGMLGSILCMDTCSLCVSYLWVAVPVADVRTSGTYKVLRQVPSLKYPDLCCWMLSAVMMRAMFSVAVLCCAVLCCAVDDVCCAVLWMMCAVLCTLCVFRTLLAD